MIYQQPVRHEFRLLKPATLLVVGLADRTTLGRGRVPEEILKDKGQYAQLGKAAAKDIPQCRLVEIPNCGHIPHLEASEQFHRTLLEFLSQ
jgi:pimeloyl-ACP methyl ester carboxylesterase